MRLTSGLYLNEENGQTFEIRDTSETWAYVIWKDFFTDNDVHSDEFLASLLVMLYDGKITYIGEV